MQCRCGVVERRTQPAQQLTTLDFSKYLHRLDASMHLSMTGILVQAPALRAESWHRNHDDQRATLPVYCTVTLLTHRGGLLMSQRTALTIDLLLFVYVNDCWMHTGSCPEVSASGLLSFPPIKVPNICSRQ
jgi:hypothetical protein